MMMMVAAANRSLSLIGLNLWQTGLRSLFKYYQMKADLTQDEAWGEIRVELIDLVAHWDPPHEEWELQLVRAIFYEEHNITLDEGKYLYARCPDSTPVIDALRTCIARSGVPSERNE